MSRRRGKPQNRTVHSVGEQRCKVTTSLARAAKLKVEVRFMPLILLGYFSAELGVKAFSHRQLLMRVYMKLIMIMEY